MRGLRVLLYAPKGYVCKNFRAIILPTPEPPKGHPQREHETSHGSMSRVKWLVEGSEGTAVEIAGHNDDGAPLMCNFYCGDLGRHVHVDYCRSVNPAPCNGVEIQHTSAGMQPNPEKPKDWITHNLYWKRMGVSSSSPSLAPLLTHQQVSKARRRRGGFRITNRFPRSILQG